MSKRGDEMSYEELLEYNKSRCMNQVSIIVPDLMETVKNWTKYLKIGPWRIVDYSNEYADRFSVYGEQVKDFSFLVAIALVNNFEIEIIQPVRGPNAYVDFLQATGGGPQHIKFSFSDEELDVAAKELTDQGFEIMQQGHMLGNRHYYIDTVDKLNCLVELGSTKLSSYPKDKIRYYPPKD